MASRVTSPSPSCSRPLIGDGLWAVLEPLIPALPPPRGPGGRPRVPDRAALEGIVFVLVTGCRWRDLPPDLGCGSGQTAWRRLRTWQRAGVWDRPHRLVLDGLSERRLPEGSRASIDPVSVGEKGAG